MDDAVRVVWIHSGDYARISETAKSLLGSSASQEAQRVLSILSAATPAGKDRLQLRVSDAEAVTLETFWTKYEYMERAQ